MIDFDSDREDSIRITKPEDMVKNIENRDTAKKMVLDDMTTLCTALGTLIMIGQDNGYFDGEKLVKMCVDYLQENCIKGEVKNNEDPEEIMP